MTTRPNETRWHWDVDIDTTKAALERLARGLILTESRLTDSMYTAPDCTLRPAGEFGRFSRAFLRVSVRDGAQDEFRAIVKPIDMRPPPLAHIGCLDLPEPADDGHPGRKR